MNPTISVLVPTYHNPVKLERCIKSLIRQNHLPDEVIVMYESEDAQTSSIVSALIKKINILPLPLKKMERMTETLNAGITKARGDIIAFLDEDIVVANEWIAKIISNLSDEQVVACGGKDVIVIHGKRVNCPLTEDVGILRWKGYIIGNQHRGIKRSKVMFLKGCNMAVRSECLMHLDRNLIGFVRWEQDIFFGLQKSGRRVVYDPEIEVFHLKDSLQQLNPRWTYWYGHNTVYLFMKYLKGKDRFLAMLFFFFIGDGSSPGFVRFPFWVLNRNERGFCSFSTSQIGKIKGFFTFKKIHFRH